MKLGLRCMRKKHVASVDELSHFICVLCGLCFYWKSLSFVIRNSSDFPMVTAALVNLGIARFKEMYNSLARVSDNNEALQTQWTSSWKFEDPAILEMEGLICRQNCRLLFNASTDFVIDNDKLRMRSATCTDQDWSQLKGINSFGLVIKIICTKACGFNIAHHINRFKTNCCTKQCCNARMKIH